MSYIDEIEQYINNKSIEIFTNLMENYNKKVVVNKSIVDIIESQIDKKYYFTRYEIVNKVIKKIPLDLYTCPDNKYVFITKEEYDEFWQKQKTISAKDIAEKVNKKDSDIVTQINSLLTEEQLKIISYEEYINIIKEIEKNW